MEVDKFEDAPQKIKVLEQEELDNHSDILSFEKEKLSFAEWAISTILGLPHAEVKDCER